jgi:RNA polymerase sigma-32 factor
MTMKEGAKMARGTVPALMSGEGGLSRYLDEIRKFPMLEPQEEFILAKRFAEHQDTTAAHRLVTSHLRPSPKLPWAIAVMACRLVKSYPKAM